MKETREEKIARLTEEFRKLLEEKFPEKGSTMQRIEEITEEIGGEIEHKIENDGTKQEGRGYVGGYDYHNLGCTPLPTSRSLRWLVLISNSGAEKK